MRIIILTPEGGVVVQLVRTLACHARGREFKSRRPRHFLCGERKSGEKVIPLIFSLGNKSVRRRKACRLSRKGISQDENK